MTSDRGPHPALALGGILLVSCVLAFVGVVPLVDHMTHRVQVLVEAVPWSRWWAPLWMPAPIEAWSLRPGAVLLTKLHTAVFGALVPPPVWAMRLGAVVSGAVFGAGAWSWLRAHGWGRLALPAAIAPLLLAPTLFSLWYVPEFDALGAGIMLFGTGLLAAPAPARRRHVLGGIAVCFAVLLKESSALLVFAFLFAEALLALREGERGRAARFGGVLGAVLLGYLALAAPLVGSKDSFLATTSVLERLPIVELNTHQYLYLVGAAGVALVGLGALLRRLPAAVRWAPLVAVALLLLLPPLSFYSHYEAVYYSPRWAASVLGGVLLLALVLGALDPRSSRPVRAAAGALLVAYGAVTVAALGASSAREDIASRTLLACAPLLFALALDGARSVLRAGGPARVGGGLLAAGLVLYPLAGAVDFSQDWLARQYTEARARTLLAQEPLEDSILAFNHYVQWVGPDELRAAGAGAAISERTAFVQTHAFLPEDALPVVIWGAGAFDLERGWEVGVPLRLYWLAARSDMPEAANAALRGDLSWTRRRVGLFTPLGDPGDREPTGPQAEHNLPEDLLWTTYSAAPTALERVAGVRATVGWQHDVGFVQIPRDLLGLPRRVLAGIPLVERYHYEARLYRFTPPTGTRVRTPDAAMLDPEAARSSPWSSRPATGGGGPGYMPPPAGGDAGGPALPSDKPHVPMGSEPAGGGAPPGAPGPPGPPG